MLKTQDQILEAINKSDEREFHIVKIEFGMSKLMARWVPNLINKSTTFGSFSKYHRFMAMDETWIYNYDQKLLQKLHSSRYLCAKITKLIEISKKVMALVLWNAKGLLWNGYL